MNSVDLYEIFRGDLSFGERMSGFFGNEDYRFPPVIVRKAKSKQIEGVVTRALMRSNDRANTLEIELDSIPTKRFLSPRGQDPIRINVGEKVKVYTLDKSYDCDGHFGIFGAVQVLDDNNKELFRYETWTIRYWKEAKPVFFRLLEEQEVEMFNESCSKKQTLLSVLETSLYLGI